MNSNSQLKNSYFYLTLLIIITGLILILVAGAIPAEYEFWINVVNNIATTLFISGGFGLLDQFLLKEKLIELILEKLKIKEEINRTGIEDVFYDINQIDYTYYLKKATKNIDIVHVYGRSWTTKYIDTLKDKILNSNCEIRVLLLSPDSKFISGFADYFNYTEEELKSHIKDVTGIWSNLVAEKNKQKRKKNQSSVTLYYHKGHAAYSLYRVDDKIIHVSNKLIKGRTSRLPSMVIKDTKYREDLFSLYLQQIDGLVTESEAINLEITE